MRSPALTHPQAYDKVQRFLRFDFEERISVRQSLQTLVASWRYSLTHVRSTSKRISKVNSIPLRQVLRRGRPTAHALTSKQPDLQSSNYAARDLDSHVQSITCCPLVPVTSNEFTTFDVAVSETELTPSVVSTKSMTRDLSVPNEP